MPKRPSKQVKSTRKRPGSRSDPANKGKGAAPSGGKPWESAKGEGSGGDPLAARFVESLSYDRRLYKHDIAGSIAHARMLKKVGLITAADLKKIEQGLKAIEKEIDRAGDAWSGWKLELEDVHMCIEAALIEKTGDAGRKLHTGRSRNDQVVTDLLLWILDANDEMSRRLYAFVSAFASLASAQGMIVMPSYTHLQRAQPIVVGGEMAAWAAAFLRLEYRFSDRLSLEFDCPLGSGAIAGSSLPLDRLKVSAELQKVHLSVGLPGESSIYMTASRDAALDFVYALSMTAMWLSRWAEQWIIYATTEFGFITLDGKYTTGSSMMPQKRNPDMLELIRGRCGGVYGNLMALLTICKGLPIGYNRDLQEDKRHVFAAYDCVKDCLEMAARIVATTRFNKDRIEATLDRGFLDATSLAEYLVTKGVPFRTAHQIVGRLVKLCEKRNLTQLSQLALADFNAACREANAGVNRCDKEVFDWLGAANVVKRYRTYGNAGVSGFQEQLKAWKERLKP